MQSQQRRSSLDGELMPYAQLDDRYHGHKKVRRALKLEPAAVAIHVMAITYCNQHNTDGVIDCEEVDDWLSKMPYRAAQKQRVLNTLLELNMLEFRVGDESYRVHDYLEWNRSSSDRANLAEQGRRGGLAKAKANGKPGPKPTPSPGSSPGSSEGQSPGSSEGSSTPRHATPTPSQASTTLALRADVEECFAYWQDRCGHPTARLTPDRRRKIEARRREGFSVQDIRQGINGAARGAFVNDNGKRFDDIELICRNGSKLEDFMGRASAQPTGRVVPLRQPNASDLLRAMDETAATVDAEVIDEEEAS